MAKKMALTRNENKPMRSAKTKVNNSAKATPIPNEDQEAPQ